MLRQIKADPDLLESVAWELGAIASEVSGIRSRINQTHDEAINAWQSKFTAQFTGSVEQTVKRIVVQDERIRVAVTNLRSAATAVRKAEQEIKNLLRSPRA